MPGPYLLLVRKALLPKSFRWGDLAYAAGHRNPSGRARARSWRANGALRAHARPERHAAPRREEPARPYRARLMGKLAASRIVDVHGAGRQPRSTGTTRSRIRCRPPILAIVATLTERAQTSPRVEHHISAEASCLRTSKRASVRIALALPVHHRGELDVIRPALTYGGASDADGQPDSRQCEPTAHCKRRRPSGNGGASATDAKIGSVPARAFI